MVRIARRWDEATKSSDGASEIHIQSSVTGRKKTPPVVCGVAFYGTRWKLGWRHELFQRIGCNSCHVETMVTAPPGTVINGGTFGVPEALGNKVIHPCSDFLLHDVGTGDGIVQVGPADTTDKLRTFPLWGLRMRPRHMHDLASLTLEDAVRRHRGEALLPAIRFRALTPEEKERLITFLNSL